MVIGIGGMSRSGKTTFAQMLKNTFLEYRVCIINLDEYVIKSTRIPMIRNRIDWEHPDSVDLERLENKIKSSKLNYELVIAEGFLIYYDKMIRELFDLKIYYSIDKSLFIKRRKEQYEEPEWYMEHVWNSYHIHHSKYKSICDVNIDQDSNLELKMERLKKLISLDV